MKAFAFAALLITAVLAQTAAEAAAKLQPAPGARHFCRAGYAWQYGCVKWGPAPPGKLFGACQRMGWGCMRASQPIQ
jgi:hypothetical protein